MPPRGFRVRQDYCTAMRIGFDGPHKAPETNGVRARSKLSQRVCIRKGHVANLGVDAEMREGETPLAVVLSL